MDSTGIINGKDIGSKSCRPMHIIAEPSGCRGDHPGEIAAALTRVIDVGRRRKGLT